MKTGSAEQVFEEVDDAVEEFDAPREGAGMVFAAHAVGLLRCADLAAAVVAEAVAVGVGMGRFRCGAGLHPAGIRGGNGGILPGGIIGPALVFEIIVG